MTSTTRPIDDLAIFEANALANIFGAKGGGRSTSSVCRD